MKSVFHPSRIGAIFILVAFAGCGQKGPLYLPTKPAPAATQPPPASPVSADGTTPASK